MSVSIFGLTVNQLKMPLQSWSLHRDPAVFPSPDRFDPERWLAKDTSAMTANLNPFGFGTRVCGGQNLAQIMLRIGVAVIARNLRIEVPPETTEKSMAIRDAFVSSLSVEQTGR